MGNQSTSGIQEEEKVENNALEKAPEVSPPDELTEEKQTLVHEHETKDEGDKSPPVEQSALIENEEHKGSGDEDCGTVSNVDSRPNEAANVTSETQEDQSMLADSCQIEADSCMIDTMATLNIDDDHIEKHKDNSAMADTPSVLVEMCENKEEIDMVRGDDHPQEQQCNSFSTLNDLTSTSLLAKDESLAVAEENLMMDELGNVDNITNIDQTHPPDQEINDFLNCSNAEETRVENDSLSSLEKVEVKADETGSNNSLRSIPTEELNDPNEDDKPIGESVLETVFIIENDHESETGIIKKCVLQKQSSWDPLSKPRFSDSETALLTESKAHKVELRKAPSFDFGLTFDSKSEESDKTPLLYEGKAAIRTNSSCSNTRLQDRRVQTEFLCKTLEYEPVEVQEKTIRMERSNSNAVIEAKQDNGIKADDGATISAKGNGKRKTRSSLFTTCLRCTAAIS